jgi:acyl transferase domain-containing protein/acyl carrier protein
MEPIAIIGMGCRFPGAANPRAFWRLMCNGVDAITEVPADRYNIDEYYDPHPATPGKVMSRQGGFLEQIDSFDAAFFKLSPREASRMDPQHRLLLEVAWEAMEDAGLVAEKLTEEIAGVFIGIITGDYWDRQFRYPADLDVYATAGSARSGAAGRLSYALGLRGVSVALDAACSSSLVAVHLACQSLRTGACTMALAGGVNIILNPDHTIGFSQGRMMAPDGHCKAFDARADGYVRSEGAGVVILKPLSRAQVDGDPIYALIRGGSSNNDGHCELFMAPSLEGQQAGLRMAYRDAGIDPRQVQYVEAHGTGTSVGDPVEINALGSVLCERRSASRPLFVGSVKTNIGHTEGAAGLAGLIKAALCLKHGMIPPNLHFHQPNPAIPWQKYALKIPTRLMPWPQSDGPRLAGVSSFGIAGTNAHIVLQEAPQPGRHEVPAVDREGRRAQLLSLSAQTPDALKDLARAYVNHLEGEEAADQAFSDICYTSNLRRTHHDHRLAVVARDGQDARAILATFLRGETAPELIAGRKIAGKHPKIAWIFPGQGSQWLGMGRDLLTCEPAFRAAIEECERVMRNYMDWSLLEQLQADEKHSRLNEIAVIQPVLFAIEVALAALWRAFGIEPDVVAGHSMGEVAAAYFAGALSLEDAAWIICTRSKLLLRASGKGAMAAVELSLEQARARVSGYEERVSVAVSNSPTSTVLSGDPQALAEILSALERDGIFGRLVKVDVASHSPQMDGLCDDILWLMQRVRPRQCTIPMFSTVKAAYLDGRELDAAYWMHNLREPVLFSDAVQALLDEDFTVFMEMSPHPILVGAIRQTAEQSAKYALALPSLRRDEEGCPVLLMTLGHLYVQGCEPDWRSLYPAGGHHVALPTYPWQRQRYWNPALDRQPSHAVSSLVTRPGSGQFHPILGTNTPSALHPNSYFWTTDISAEIFPYLNEHCVHDMPVLPCAAYIELALAAASEIFGPQRFSIEDLTLKKTLFFPKGSIQTLQVILRPEEEGNMSLYFYSAPGRRNGQAPSWVLHATAHVRREEEPLKSNEIIQPPCERSHDEWMLTMETESYYRGLRARGIQHGPLFQGITRVWRRPGAVMASITIPQAVADDMSGYQIHPALLDSILQGITPFLPDEREDDTYVPVAVRRIRLYWRPGPDDRLWTHAVVRPEVHGDLGTLTGDVFLLNEQGQVLLEVQDFRLQSLDASTQDFMPHRLNQLLYTINWEERARREELPAKVAERKKWLIFGWHDGPGQKLAQRLRASGASCMLAIPGCVYRRVREHEIELSPRDFEQFRRLLEDWNNESDEQAPGIVYLWSMLTEPVHGNSLQALRTNQDLTCIGVLHLLQAIAAVPGELSPRLWLVTNGVHAIEEGERMVALSQAPLWGLGRVIVYEYQNLHTTLIDLDAAPTEESLAALYREICADGEEDEIALRGEKRYVARLAHHTLAESQNQMPALFREDGTYLITGGLGGVGLRTAQWMIEQGARHLVLMGRHGASSEAEATLQAMRKRGATISVIKGDVAQEERLADALAEIRRTLPPLRGIFHSAVVLDDSILLQMDRERFLSVMPPKVEGAWNLHSMTLNEPLDYFVLFSSAASLIGSPGQGNYAAANAFMDQLAQYRRLQGYPALCINWGRWGEVGQATKQRRGERLDVRGFASIKPEEGLAILGSLLRQSPPQVGVMSFHLPKWSQFYPHLAHSSLFAYLLKEGKAQDETAVGAPHLTRAMLAELDAKERQQKLAQYLNDRVARVLGYNALQLDAHQQFNRLGIDSLMAVELKNRIGSDLNVVIPVAAFLQGITFEQLIAQIGELVA